MNLERGNPMNLWIRMLTWSRLLLGAGAGACFACGHFTVGAILFTIGLFTKAIDTPLAEWRKCPIPADDKLYRLVAVLFNGAAFFGLMFGLCRMAYSDELSWLYPILLLAINGGLMSVSLLGKWIPRVRPHSTFAKLRSGIISLVIVAFVHPFVPFWIGVIADVCIGVGEWSKVVYYSRQENLSA